MKKYTSLVAAFGFLALAVITIVTGQPAIYVTALVLGFMFLFQGIREVRKG